MPVITDIGKMRTSLVFLAIVGFVAGAQAPWKTNKEYTYNIYSRTLTALPDLKDQYVGIVTKGKLLLHPKGNEEVVGKLVKIAHAHYHDDLVGGWNTEIPEQGLSFQESELSNKAFIMHMKNGVIKSISVDASMTNDQVNQLKAILGQLQVDINGENLIKCKHNQLPEKSSNKPNALYKIMEPTVMGECETMYDIESLPEYMVERSLPDWAPRMEMKEFREQGAKNEFFQIFKTTNFDNCNIRKGYHFGFPGKYDVKPNTNRMGDFLSKSSMTMVIASGRVDDYIIHEVHTTNRIAVSPAMYQEQKAQVISQIQLALVKVQDVSKQMEGPQQRVNAGNLVYRYNIPSDKQNKIREGDSQQTSGGGHLRTKYNQYGNYESNYEESNESGSKRFRREIDDDEFYGNTNLNKKYQYNRGGPTSSSSSSSSSSSESDEDWNAASHHFQPLPNMQQAPEIPLHPFTVGYRGHSIRHDSKINVEQEVKRLVNEIVDDLQNQDEIPKRDTLEKFDILTDVIRIMNYEEIQNVAQQFKLGNQQSNNLPEILASKTYRDAVAQSGSGPAVKAVTKWISERKVRGDEAAELFTQVTKNIRTPTDEMIKVLFNLIKSDEVKKQESLYPTALIAFTNLLKRAQVDKRAAYNYYPVQSFGPFYKYLEQLVTKEVIPYLGQRLQDSVQQKNAQRILLYLRALGNIGHPEIIGVYEKYIEGQHKFTPFQRTALVISLDRLTETYPRFVRRVLYKIYANVAETPETRTAAVHLLMRTKPSAAMLQRMAEYTHDDPSETVQAVVKSAIETAAELDAYEWEELAQNAESARKFLNPRAYGRQYSKTYLRDYVSENLNLIYKQQLTHIVGRDNTFPQSVLYTVYKNYGGLEIKNIEVQAMISSVDELLRLIPSARSQNDWDSSEQHSRDGSDQWSTKRIAEMLKIEREEAEQLEGEILFNIMGQKRFYSFDEKTLKELPQILAASASVFKGGEKIALNKFHNPKRVTVAFPLVTGYPFIYTYSLPTLMQAVGEIQGKTTPDIMQSPTWENMRQVHSVNFTAKVHLVYSTEQITKTGFITPFDHQRYVAGYVRKAQAHVPMNMKIDIDFENRQLYGKMAPLEANKDVQLYQASAWPFTARKDILNLQPITKAKEIKLIQTRKMEKYERVIGEKSTGMAFHAIMEHQFPYVGYSNVEETFQGQGVLSFTSLPSTYQSIMRGISTRSAFSPATFLPFSFNPTMSSPPERQLLMTLAALPFAEDLTTPELVNLQGIFSLISLPFADVETLERTTQHEGILTLGAFPWPLRALNQYRYVLKYDAQRSANQIMKFTMNLRRAFNADKGSSEGVSNRVAGPASADEQKLAQPNDVSPNSEQRQKQFLENVAFGIKQAYSVLFDASLVFEGKSPAEYVATIARADSSVDEKRRVLAFLSGKSAKKSSGKQICATYTDKFPHSPVLGFEDAIKHNNKGNAKIQIQYGENCKASPTQINVKVALEQTPEYQEHLRHSEFGKRCQYEMKQGDNLMLGCLEATYRANILNKFEITGDIQNPTPEINNITHRALSLLRHAGFWHLDENVNEKGQPNKMEATIRISPNLKFLDAYLKTGSMSQKYSKLRIADPIVESFFKIHREMYVTEGGHKMDQELFRNGHVCVVDAHRIVSFDDNILKPELGQCWYTVFQHIQSKSRAVSEKKWKPKDVSILVRAAQESNKKELMIVVGQKNGGDHVVHLKPTGSSIHVTVNGQEKKISSDRAFDVFENDSAGRSGSGSHHTGEDQKPTLRIVQWFGNELRIEVRGRLMQVYYDGVRVKVHASPVYRNNIRGLCGNYNGERVDDLITPKNCVINNDKLFAATWALPEQSCSNEVKQMKSKAEQAHCSPIDYYYGGNMISNYEAGRRHIDGLRPSSNYNKWSSEDSSSSSSSSEEVMNRNRYRGRYSGERVQQYGSSSSTTSTTSQRLQGGAIRRNQAQRNNNCNLREQVQFVEINGRTCFSVENLPACPSHCQAEDTEQTQVPVHCRDSTDSVAQLFKQQILKGANPDMSGKKVNNNLNFNIPRKCVAVN